LTAKKELMTKVANSTYEKRLQNIFHKMETGKDYLTNKIFGNFQSQKRKKKNSKQKNPVVEKKHLTKKKNQLGESYIQALKLN
jgi:hypothetical protein